MLSLNREASSLIKVGKKQTFETLVNEEALLFAKYLREEKKDWKPRLEIINNGCK